MWGVTGEDEDFQDGEGDTAAVSIDTDSTVPAEEAFTIPRVVIAFGSETGTAEVAVGRLARALRLCKPIVSFLNKVAGLDIIKQRKASHLIVLCSTFGKGQVRPRQRCLPCATRFTLMFACLLLQPPSNATTFFETKIPDGILNSTKVAGKLSLSLTAEIDSHCDSSHCYLLFLYAVLCLGSLMYPDFCQAGKTVNKLLANAGAQMMAPATTADEAVDSAGTIAQWLKLMKTLVLPDSLDAAIEARMGVANEPLMYKVKWKFENTKTKTERYVWPVDKSSLCLMNEELLVGGDIPKRSTR